MVEVNEPIDDPLKGNYVPGKQKPWKWKRIKDWRKGCCWVNGKVWYPPNRPQKNVHRMKQIVGHRQQLEYPVAMENKFLIKNIHDIVFKQPRRI